MSSHRAIRLSTSITKNVIKMLPSHSFHKIRRSSIIISLWSQIHGIIKHFSIFLLIRTAKFEMNINKKKKKEELYIFRNENLWQTFPLWILISHGPNRWNTMNIAFKLTQSKEKCPISVFNAAKLLFFCVCFFLSLRLKSIFISSFLSKRETRITVR